MNIFQRANAQMPLPTAALIAHRNQFSNNKQTITAAIKTR